MPVMVSVSEEGEGGPPGASRRAEGLGLPPGGQEVTGGRDGNVVDSGGGTLAELGGVHRGHDPPVDHAPAEQEAGGRSVRYGAEAGGEACDEVQGGREAGHHHLLIWTKFHSKSAEQRSKARSGAGVEQGRLLQGEGVWVFM